MDIKDDGLTVGPDVVHFVAEVVDFDAVVGFGVVVGMEDDEVHAGNGHVVFCFENVAVGVELEGIVPEVAVGHVGQTGNVGGLFAVGRFVFNLFGAFPVVDKKFSGVSVAENHVDGSTEFEFFVEDTPFGAVGFELGKVGEEVAEVGEFDGIVLDIEAIVVLFDVEMHESAGAGGFVTGNVPFEFDGFGRHLVVLVPGVVFPTGVLDYFGHAGLGVKMGKEAMVPGGHAGILAALAIDLVNVSFLKKTNELLGLDHRRLFHTAVY